jgi:hypothetical protein
MFHRLTRNQFDTLGKALAQYMPVLSCHVASDKPLIGRLSVEIRPAFTWFGEISLELLKP